MLTEAEKDRLAYESKVRDKARKKLLAFVKMTMPRYRISWHHRIIADAFERFARGESKRLIITAPPRTGKSQLVSRHGPAWLLGNNPEAKVLCTSHTAHLAAKMSSDVRNLVRLPAYRELFPEIRLGSMKKKGEDAVKDAAAEWELIGHSGGMMSVGRAGALAGYDVDFAIIDDPFKSREEANSEAIREKAWDWLQDDVLMRLGAAGPCLIMHTRWHENDLIGRILDAMGRDPNGEQWEVINLPAAMEEDTPFRHPDDHRAVGDTLWPWYYAGKDDKLTPEETELKAREFLKAWEKRNIIGYVSLGQQRPQPKGTRIFPVDKIETILATDQRIVKSVRYWDNAGTKDAGCYTAGVRVSLLADKSFLVEHVERFQEAALRREAIKKATAKRDGIRVRVYVEQEPGSSGKDVAEATQRNLAGNIVGVDKVTGDKILRAEVAATQVQGGNVKILKGEWNADFLDELKTWPNGTYKDQGDAFSGAIAKLVGKNYNAEAMGMD